MSGIGGMSCEMYEDPDALAEIRRITLGDQFRPKPPTETVVAHMRRGLHTQGSRPESAGLAGVDELARRERAALTMGDDTFTSDMVDGARRELAAMHPLLDAATVEDAVLALTGGERDVESQGLAIAELAAMEPRDIQRLAVAWERDGDQPARKPPGTIEQVARMRTADGRVTTIELTGEQLAQLGHTPPADEVGRYLALAAKVTGPFGQRASESAFDPDFSNVPSPLFKVHDVGSSQDGERDERTEAEVARLLQAHAGSGRFHDVNAEDRKVDSGVRRYGPTPYRDPGRSGRPQNARDIPPAVPRGFGRGPGDGSEG